MRIVNVITLFLILGASAPAFAQAPPLGQVTPERGAMSSAQPQIPPAIAPNNDLPNADASSNAMPVQPIQPPVVASEPNLKQKKASSYIIKDAPLPDDFVLGKATAPVLMIEYASLSCPHCAHFSNAVLPELQKKYIDTGKMRYILRQFPLNEPALKGAMLLDCVGEQDKAKYYTFAKVLFDAQSKWAFDSNYLTGLQTIAEVGGLSKDQFQKCVNNSDREMKVLKAKKLATDEIAIPHTPYVFINGEVYEGDRSMAPLSAYIDKKLEQSGK